MTYLPSVELQQNANGEFIHITIDLQKYPHVVPLLREGGYLPKTQADLESDFDNGFSVDEVFDGVKEKIREHFAKRTDNNPDN